MPSPPSAGGGQSEGHLSPPQRPDASAPIVEDIIARAVVRRFIGALHQDADSVGAKSTQYQLLMLLFASEIDARAQLMRSGLQRESLAGVQHLIEIALAAPLGRELDEAHAESERSRPTLFVRDTLRY
jgi:hypothetical protein